MLNKMIELAAKPKRAPSRRMLLAIFGLQAMVLLFVLLVVNFWPDRAFAVGPLLFLCLGLTVMLWLEALQGQLGTTDKS